MNIKDIDELANTISVNLKTPGIEESTAEKISENLSSLEHKLLALYSEPSKGTEAEQKAQEKEIASTQLKYQRAMRVYDAFQTLMKNMHEIMLRGIQNLRVS